VAARNEPNIILINCDDLGYGDVGCYGSPLNRTPAIDSLAAEGMRFTDFYMGAPLCTPSRAAMMTGCYPRRVGLGTNERGSGVLFPGDAAGLNPDEITIATILQGRGYATRLVGKWHLGDQPEFLPTRHGFDSYYGLPYSNDMGIMEWRQTYPPLPLMRDEAVIQEQPEQAALTERYTEECIRFMRENRDRPFFLYLAHMYVHVPLYTPRRFLERSQNGAYGAAVEFIDWSTAALLHELRRLGLEQDTLVIFTSDNGGALNVAGSRNLPLRGGKATTWEGGLRVPCIMRWPGRVPAGTVCSELATAMDFLPTFARLAGAEPPDDRIIDGKDIRPLMFAQSDAHTPYDAYFYYFRNDLEAVRAGRWKLHLKSGELYDLEADIGETSDLAAQEPDIVRDLMAKADACRRDLGDAATGAEGENCRPCGMVEEPRPLTEFDPDNPYMVAMYDWGDGEPPERGKKK